MSIESTAAAPSSAAATPRASAQPPAAPSKVDVAQFTPGSLSTATQHDYHELGDVLLGEDMSMMGSEVENWNSTAHGAAVAKPPTLMRAATTFLPPHHQQHQHQHQHQHAPTQRPSLHQSTSHAQAQAQSTQTQAMAHAHASQAPTYFASPPVQLTRHASLPVTMMRAHPMQMHGHPHAHHVNHMPFAMSPMHHHQQLHHAQHHPQMVAMAPGPPLSRQRSHGFIMQAPMPHPHAHAFGMPRLVFHHPITGQPMTQVHHMQVHHPMASNINLSVAHQQPTNATTAASGAAVATASSSTEEKRAVKSENVEPIAFTGMSDARMSLGEIDSLALAALSEPSKKDKDGDDDDEGVYGKPSTASSIGCGQDLARALDSLDKFLPEADTDHFRLSDFRPSDLATMVAPQPPSTASLTSHLVTPRTMAVPTSGRSALPLIMSPHMKTVTSPAQAMTMMLGVVPHSHLHTPRASPKPMATCKVGGCDRRVRSKGFCKTHGGGRKCSIDGCKKSSQNGEFCIGHGGGKKCKQDGCAKAAQSHGLCKAHGGGARCKYPNCNKSSQGGGLCRAHGGGKRCQAQGCPKGAQRGNFCATHGGFRNCKVDGCVRTDRGGGFCEVHRRGRLCKIDGCKKLSRNQGMCTMHIREDKQESGAGSDEYAASDDEACVSASESPLLA